MGPIFKVLSKSYQSPGVSPNLLQTSELIELSKTRIKNIDRQRRSIEVSSGHIEPKLENMKLGEAKTFRLAVLHIDINEFKKKVAGLSQDNYLRLVSIFLTEMTEIVHYSSGSVELYVGDQVTALFGLDHNCDKCNPEDSLRCSLNMQTVIKYSINPYFSSIGLPNITCSIGMDYGNIWLAKVGVRGSILKFTVKTIGQSHRRGKLL
jgi:adenylate cyclase